MAGVFNINFVEFNSTIKSDSPEHSVTLGEWLCQAFYVLNWDKYAAGLHHPGPAARALTKE